MIGELSPWISPYFLGMDVVEQARRYVAGIPGAVAGQGGHAKTYRVALALVHGFALPPPAALQILTEWGATCSPQWDPSELRHKINSAAKSPARKPAGYLIGHAGQRGVAGTHVPAPLPSAPEKMYLPPVPAWENRAAIERYMVGERAIPPVLVRRLFTDNLLFPSTLEFAPFPSIKANESGEMVEFSRRPHPGFVHLSEFGFGRLTPGGFLAAVSKSSRPDFVDLRSLPWAQVTERGRLILSSGKKDGFWQVRANPMHVSHCTFPLLGAGGEIVAHMNRGVRGKHQKSHGKIVDGLWLWGETTKPRKMVVAEAVIDTISRRVFDRMLEQDRGVVYSATFGSTRPLRQIAWARAHHIPIEYSHDADSAGRARTPRDMALALEQGVTSRDTPPPLGKDWNDTLRRLAAIQDWEERILQSAMPKFVEKVRLLSRRIHPDRKAKTWEEVAKIPLDVSALVQSACQICGIALPPSIRGRIQHPPELPSHPKAVQMDDPRRCVPRHPNEEKCGK